MNADVDVRSSPGSIQTDEGVGSSRGRPGRRGKRGSIVILLAGVLFTIVTGVAGAGLLTNLKSGGFDDPGSDSVAASTILADRFPGSDPNLAMIVEVPEGLDSPAADDALVGIERAVARVAGAGVTASYATSPQLADGDTRGAVLVAIPGDEDTVQRATASLRSAIRADVGSPVTFGGIAGINDDLNTQVESDIILAESIAIPLTLILLFFIFRGAVAALIPVGVAAVTIVGSLGILNLIAQVTSVSVFAVNLVTALGLGLAIDYCLLFLTRYRDERARGASDRAALASARRKSVPTIVISGTTVAAALASLFLFEQYFLRSFALAGLLVVACTVLGAVFLLPAALSLLGPRIDWAQLRMPARRAGGGKRFWHAVGDTAYRRPWLALPVIAVLVVMALPFGHAQFGVPDERTLPAGAESRVVTEQLRSDFGLSAGDSLTAVTENWKGTDADLEGYAGRLSEVAGVTSVTTSTGVYADGRLVVSGAPALGERFKEGSALWLRMATDVVSYSAEGTDLVRQVRAVRPGGGSEMHIGGLAAQMSDINASISSRLPAAAGLIAVLTLAILFLFTGSVLLPIKALILNVLGLVSILGLSVFIFQDGHFANLLDFTPSPIAVSIPILLFCIAFGLSMDYEIFLLARIQEKFHASGDLRDAVRSGLGASGPIISAAAIILAVSFFAMATSGVSLIKMLGLGTGVAILIDATLIRGVLVPVFMRLAGRYNWWAPRWLRAVHRRIGIREG